MMNPALNPIQQRLFLYRFAYVHLAPGLILDPAAWGLHGLQALPGEQDPGWRFALQACRPYSPVVPEAVISPSLRILNRLRRLQPQRPLILCRTAFEDPPAADRLRRLPARRSGWTEFLAPSDATRPLFWLCERPAAMGDQIAASRLYPDHPYRARIEILRKACPASDWWVQEDGSAVEQLKLFCRNQDDYPPTPFRDECGRYDDAFRRQLGHPAPSCYVFSRNPVRLAWFRRDCRRLLPAATFCWNYPDLPDRRDPLRHFLLIADHAVKHRRLEQRLPCLHLDGDNQRCHYRSARLGLLGTAAWFGMGRAFAWASKPLAKSLAANSSI